MRELGILMVLDRLIQQAFLQISRPLVLLDDVDKELEKRGPAFVRREDDSNVHVRTKRAMKLLWRLYAKLKFCINEPKSAVAFVTSRNSLGYGFLLSREGKAQTHSCRSGHG